jgi:hypothetical protein
MRDIFKAVLDTLPEPPPGEGPWALSMPGRLESLLEQAGLRIVGSGLLNSLSGSIFRTVSRQARIRSQIGTASLISTTGWTSKSWQAIYGAIASWRAVDGLPSAPRGGETRTAANLSGD